MSTIGAAFVIFLDILRALIHLFLILALAAFIPKLIVYVKRDKKKVSSKEKESVYHSEEDTDEADDIFRMADRF